MRVTRDHAFTRCPSLGFTLVELLVVIAIIGVLVGMSVPAMQNMREMSRRSNCEQNLVQISLALSAYSLHHAHFPAGTFNETGPIESVPVGYHQNWVSGLLPFLDANNVYEAIDFEYGVYAPANAAGTQCESAASDLSFGKRDSRLHDVLRGHPRLEGNADR